MYYSVVKNLWFQVGCAVLLGVGNAFGATVNVSVGSFFFNPANVTINVNDSVQWTFTGVVGHTSTHNGNPPLWNSGTRSSGQTFTFTFTTSGNYPYRCNIHPTQHSGSVNVQQGTVNTPPTVTITSPSAGAVINAPASFTFSANASDTGGGSVTQVEFFRDTTSLGADTTSPYSVAVNNLGAGTYNLRAVATDNGGARATNSISVIVNALPSVTLSSPTNGATFPAPFSGTLQAMASDSDGSVARVQFFGNNQLLGTVTTAPYNLAVTNVGAGTHVLSAVATDNRGATNVSAAVTISVVASQPVTISGAQRPSASQFSFNYTAQAGSRYVIEGSPNLASWTALGTNTASSSTASFTDSNAVSTMFFYRVRRDGSP